MDALRQHDIESSRNAPPGEKLAQTVELMTTGIRLKRMALQRALPQADAQEIERALEEWLFSDA
jgi:hypothetical protein